MPIISKVPENGVNIRKTCKRQCAIYFIVLVNLINMNKLCYQLWRAYEQLCLQFLITEIDNS